MHRWRGTRVYRQWAVCGPLAVVLLVPLAGQQRDKALRVILPERKLALVIGNEAYGGQWALSNPVRDAGLVAGVLEEELSFDEVQVLTDLATDEEMKLAVEEFARRLQANDLAFFYYSGHGIEVEDRNYLLPTGFDSGTERRFVPHRTLPQEEVLTALNKARLSVLVLDACRDNPYTKGGGGWAHQQGKAEKGKGILIAYATDKGDTASDSGFYAEHLVAKLKEPGLELQEVFQEVKEEVASLTRGDQNPQHYPNIIGDYYFLPTDAPPPLPSGGTSSSTVVVDPGEERARGLLRQAARLAESARGIEAREAQLALLEEVRNQLAGITYGHPETETARKLLAGETVAGISVRDVEERIAELARVSVPPPRLSTEPEGRSPTARRAGQTRTFDGMEFVWIPAGEFVMGSESEHAYDVERPLTRVRISEGYWLGKYEVTQGEWAAVMGSNPSRFDECGRECPVEVVSWLDVQEYIGKLNEGAGAGMYRLPSEAEWEYAARAGDAGGHVCGGRDGSLGTRSGGGENRVV